MNGGEAVQQASEWMMYARALFALLFVVALIFLTSALARKYGLDKRIAGLKGQAPTLSVLEIVYVDPRHKLVRVRAGLKEHVLLLGPTASVVVSSQDVEGKQDAT